MRRTHARWWERPRRWLTQDAVYKCGHCHYRVWVPYEEPLPLLGVVGGLAAAGIVIALGFACWRVLGSPPPAPQMTEATPSRPPSPRTGAVNERLALLSARTYNGAIGDFRFVEGEVRNLTGDRLDHVEAVCTWFDQRGRVISVESSPIAEAPLLPGRTSAFKSMTMNRPDLARFSILFRHVDGRLLATFDRPETTDAVGTSGTDPVPAIR